MACYAIQCCWPGLLVPCEMRELWEAAETKHSSADVMMD
jgi:hypothetical protein